MKRYFVSAADVAAHIDPLSASLWWGRAMTEDEIRAADLHEYEPWELFAESLSLRFGASVHKQPELVRDYHVQRIAYFVANGIPLDDPYPVTLTIKGDGLNIQYGRHRMAAAFMRRETQVEAVIDGSEESIRILLPNAKPVAAFN